jgi:hypothetical protein
MRTRASRDTSPRSATHPRIMQHEHSTSAHRPTLTLLRSSNAQPSIFVRNCRFWNNGSLSSFWRLTLPCAHSFNHQQRDALLQINNSPFPPTRHKRRRVVRRPMSPLSTCLTTNLNRPRPSSSISPTTAKSSQPGSNVPRASLDPKRRHRPYPQR